MNAPDRSPPDLHREVDLDVLRRSDAAPAPRRRIRPATVTAFLLVAGLLLALVQVVLRPLLFPPVVVRLAQVRTAVSADAPRTAVTEAAGWIEADPFPVTVRPLVPGVVQQLDVLEGQAVKADETVIAVLRNVGLENALEVAKSVVRLREAELALAEAHLETDRSILEQRLVEREAVARQEGDLGTTRAALASARAARGQAEATHRRAALDLDALDDLERAGSSTPLARERAKARMAEAEAGIETARYEEALAAAEVARVERLLEIAREGVEDPRALAGRVAEDERDVERARAALALARTDLQVAQRNVDLLTVRAPVDGIVMRLEAAPGGVVGPEGDMRPGSEEGTGSTGRLDGRAGGLVSLYDPRRLQARVDVLLGEVKGIGAGTQVEVVANALPGRTFDGVVDRLLGEADLLKNTLQVKVRITDPDPLLRPEMLVTARFLLPRQEASSEAQTVVHAFVPAEAVRDGAVWIYDPRDGGRARRIAVEVVARQGGEVEVAGPLGSGHKVILDPVEDGQAVRGRP